jgi:5-enolpyruvylshikimate-3-phosphate synthase
MPLPALLPIQPFTRPARGDVVLPGSKSLTNRALLFAALCDEPLELTGALFSDDTRLMGAALQTLGFDLTLDEQAGTMRLAGQRDAFPGGEHSLFVGLAGTAARFLTALCAAAPRGVYRIDGVPQMRNRPMQSLIDALRALGADITCLGAEGFFPLEIKARGLDGGRVSIDASASSQLLSALLMVAPLARGPIEVQLVSQVRWTFVEMTRRLMAEFGVVTCGVDSRGRSTFVGDPGPRMRSPGGLCGRAGRDGRELLPGVPTPWLAAALLLPRPAAAGRRAAGRLGFRGGHWPGPTRPIPSRDPGWRKIFTRFRIRS